MTNRLVWNFEFTPSTNFLLSNLDKVEEDELKWEARFFWPETEIITLQLLDNDLLELAHYQHKQKSDKYYLLKQGFNIKNRRDELVYKPLIKKGKYSLGFGHKLNLSEPDNFSPDLHKSDLKKIMTGINHSTEVSVKKESFSYKFATHPHTKIELARIEINSAIYFTLCIEGKSRYLVEKISKKLLGKRATENYVGFLKEITGRS